MTDKLRSIPDTVDEFTGFIGSTYRSDRRPATRRLSMHDGKAHVRNVDAAGRRTTTSIVPVTDALAEDADVRDWINAYVPGDKRDTSTLPPNAAPRAVGAPTSGTASRSTGASRRSDSCARRDARPGRMPAQSPRTRAPSDRADGKRGPTVCAPGRIARLASRSAD